MLDNSFIYKDDFDKLQEEYSKQDHRDIFESIYKSGRLGDEKSEDTKVLLENYNKNVKIMSELVKDNYQLQHLVHSLGIKNRIKKKLGKYRPPESVRMYVSHSEIEKMISGSYVANKLMPELSVNGTVVDSFRKKFGDPFKEGIDDMQKKLTLSKPKVNPLVSIIIPTRDGLTHLNRLFNNFKETTAYENYEIIVVDNASVDDTVSYLKKLSSQLPISIIENSENKSFSESNNIAAKKAKGELLLFLNNDVEPTYGWLNQMVATAVNNDAMGAVGAKLIYPNKEGFEYSYKIQHGGISFRLEEDFIRPVNQNSGSGFFQTNTAKEELKAAVTAACLLVPRSVFVKVNGFDEEYWYGYEDVDLCLKIDEAGYKNVINNSAVLYHYEFGTQEKNKSDTISEYRKKNISVFKRKWQKKLYIKYWKSLLAKDRTFADKDPHICFVTTEASENTAAGDYFTAKEFSIALEKKGFKTSFIGVRNTPKPYEIDSDVDIIISMIDGYDISKISNKRVIKVAWCRNWFERWAEHTYFREFDIVLSNSEIAQKFFKDKYHLDSHIFKIATNSERFSNQFSSDALAEYKSDVCFTGNYWHDPRDITKLFDPSEFKDKHTIKIYGRDWDQVKEFSPFHQGFIEYKNIPKVYKAGKILIDDATWIVNKWGSVNSRVFDGAASGILTFSNGVIGGKNTFEGILPTFSSKEELRALINKYLGSEDARIKKAKELQDYVLKHHTYDVRAEQFLEILKTEYFNPRINIKMPIPSWAEAKSWGDLHFSLGIKKALEKKNYRVKLQILPEWENANFNFANIVLRGLSVYKPNDWQTNIMWNISHPEKISLKEYSEFDYVFVASKKHSNLLKNRKLKNVHILYQCFDPDIFKPVKSDNKTDILFVGNTRNIFRNSVKFLMQWDKLEKYKLEVYGKGWEKFIDQQYVHEEHINNDKLAEHYSNTKILLNDHWEDMNNSGFASNRIFDATACKTFIISDKNSGIDDVLGKGAIEQYETMEELHGLLDKYLDDSKLRNKKVEKIFTEVLKKHTFDNRIEEMLSIIKEFQYK